MTAASHPFLIDHAIDNVPVLPVVMALEWFARAARAARPGQELTVCRDLRVMKGARLGRYDNGGDPFTVVCREDGDGRLELELRGADGTLHYTAAAELAGTLPVGAAPRALAGLERYSRATYGDELFHGPQFQVIRSVEGVSTEGAVALLDGARACGWPDPGPPTRRSSTAACSSRCSGAATSSAGARCRPPSGPITPTAGAGTRASCAARCAARCWAPTGWSATSPS